MRTLTLLFFTVTTYLLSSITNVISGGAQLPSLVGGVGWLIFLGATIVTAFVDGRRKADVAG